MKNIISLVAVTLVFLFGAPAVAQVRIACTPEPLAVTSALHVKTMGQWACFILNDGPAARTLAPEAVYTAIIGIRPIDPASAIIVLSDRQSHSFAATAVKVLSIAGQLSGVALSLASKANAGLGTGLAVGSGFLPTVISVAQGQVPSTSPFTERLLAAPITLPPQGAVTKTVFACKQKNPQSITVVLP